MKLRTATLVVKGAKIGEGITEPCRAIVRVDGSDIAVILKEVSLPSVAAECFAALLLREWGLNVPEPVLVDINGVLAFGSAELMYPSFHQKFQYELIPDELKQQVIAHMANIIRHWKQTPLAITIDEVIGNKDRNIGNILWDGGEPYFIDHERCFNLVSQVDMNKLAELSKLGADDANAILQAAVTAAQTLTLGVMHEVETVTANLDTKSYSDYIKSRMPHLVMMVLNRFPQPKDLLSETLQ
jgi:hypothetical protein